MTKKRFKIKERIKRKEIFFLSIWIKNKEGKKIETILDPYLIKKIDLFLIKKISNFLEKI